MKKLLFNLTFYPLLIIVTVVMAALCTLGVFVMMPFISRRRMLWVVRHLIRWYGLVVIKGISFPFVRIVYKDYEKEKCSGPCVYVCNHRSSSDGFLMAALGIECVQVVNKWPFKIPVIGWIAQVAEYLNVRSMPFEEFEQKACRLLKENVSIVAFPEGSRSMDTEVHQFNGAVFRVAQKAGVPVVPVCLSGNQTIPDKKTGVLHPGTILIHKLPAFCPGDYKEMSSFKLKNEVRQRIQTEVDRLEKNN